MSDDDDDEANSDTEGETNEIGDDDSEEFDPNELENDGEQEEFNPNDDNGEIEPKQFDPGGSENIETQKEFNPNVPDAEVIPEEFNPNSDEESDIPEFDPNSPEDNKEQDEFDDTENFDPYDHGDHFEKYSDFENEYAQTMSTILITENEMVAYLREYVEAMREKENEQATQGEQNEIDNLENEPSELEQFLEQEKERIRLEQQQTELDKTVEKEPESESITVENDVEQEGPCELIEPEPETATFEEKVEQEQQKEVEPQVDSSEELPNNEEDVNSQDHQVDTEEFNEHELEQTKYEEEVSNQEVKREEIQANNNVEELDDDENVEQQELEITQEINRDETEIATIYQEEEEEELEQELEIRETEKIKEEPQQELDDILEEIREIEQDALAKREQDQDQERSDNSIEQKVEQEKENEWLEYLVNWVKEEAGEELNLQTKEELLEIVEDYNELDELTTKFQELYQKEQNNQLSPAEQLELKNVIKTLQKNDPSNVVLFTNLRAMKRYLTRQKLEKPQVNQILKHFFTRFSPKKQLNRILKAKLSLEQIKKEIKKIDWKSISKNWTVKVSANKEITLNPYEPPSKENPLYKHKQWLQTVYNRKNWNLNDNMLRKISGVSNTTVHKWRKKFDIPTKLKLFNDGKQKECGRCHQIKPINEFGTRMTGGKKSLFSRCKTCRININQIYKYNNKVKIIQNVYNGKLKGKCQSCSADIKKLPSLEFHHLDPKLKSGKGISLSRNWEETKKQVEREKATILCANCHTKQRSKYYNKYEKIIQENSLSPSASNNQISQYAKNKLPNADYEVRRQVTQSIKKQIIIDHLYEGKCVGCGDVSTKDNLPALQFHHRDKNNPYKMSKTYVNLRNLEIKEIIKKLKKENCIPLCGNCHRMEQSTQFKNNYEKIVDPKYWDNIKKNYEMIENNIKNFKFKS